MDQRTQQTKTKKILSTNVLVKVGMLSAIAVILMLFEFPLPFAPGFYKLDFSELPVIIGAFAIGPAAGAMIEFIKIILNLLINGTTTAGVGETANFIIGCFFVLPAAVIYHHKKTKKMALLGMSIGTILMTVVGCFVNAYILLPVYGKAFHMEINKLIELGTAINPAINSLGTFILLAVAPFNLLKGTMVSIFTMLIYKRVSFLLNNFH